MSRRDLLAAAAAVAPPLLRDGEPVFSAPWEAQAFALTLALHGRGLFTWNEWAAALGSAIRAAQADGDPDDGSTAYVPWLTALETLLTAKGVTDEAALQARRDAWDRAARATPHGASISLDNDPLRAA